MNDNAGDEELVYRGVTAAGVALIVTAGLGFVGHFRNWWPTNEYPAWAALLLFVACAVVGVLLVASRGRALPRFRSIKVLGAKIQFVEDAVKEHATKLGSIEQRLQVSATAQTTISNQIAVAAVTGSLLSDTDAVLTKKSTAADPLPLKRYDTAPLWKREPGSNK